eukprot:CAMPEP_0117620298 /NCGR_PEP_ID=MMETSP0784-20121206/87057_1 /TAXON_ID=39447 /ORGANISM="" /LENGTH=630 /DNA_ID=CAMNT_0005424209 /DNA_START=39 /DNA_END=1928 /DNA_ORIENTATION=-
MAASPDHCDGAGDAVLLKVGQRVEVHGLLNVSHLNGQVGVLTLYEESSGRWGVSLRGGCKKIKPSNLRPHPAGHLPTSKRAPASAPSTDSAKTALVPGLHASGADDLMPAAMDRAWAMKRDWTDMDFQDGEVANKAKLQEFEDTFVARLRQSCAKVLGTQTELGDAAQQRSGEDVLSRVLAPLEARKNQPSEGVRAAVLKDPEVLGSALDIVGAYLKNYEIDKAAAIIDTLMPVCRERGGFWRLKALNHLSTVRMKQARPQEALVTLQEIEAFAMASLQPEDMDEAWEFWDVVYRNFAWALSNVERAEESIGYIEKAIAVKERVGRPPSWSDLWDLGRFKATTALARNSPKDIVASQKVVNDALWLHRDAEPSDFVMRAKIWHSVGECSFALGHLAEVGPAGAASEVENLNATASSSEAQAHYRKALKCFREAYKLFNKTEGQYNPLTGSEAQAVSWALLKIGSAEDAKPYLLDSLEAYSRQQSGWGKGDGLDANAPALTSAMQVVDRIMEAHRMTEDRAGLEKYFSAIERLCLNISRRLQLSKEQANAAVYEKLVSTCSMVMVASGTERGVAKSQELLRTYMWTQPSTPQARICTEMMQALPSSTPGACGGQDRSSAGMAALLQELARR